MRNVRFATPTAGKSAVLRASATRVCLPTGLDSRTFA
jgi:hypothetical protein